MVRFTVLVLLAMAFIVGIVGFSTLRRAKNLESEYYALRRSARKKIKDPAKLKARFKEIDEWYERKLEN